MNTIRAVATVALAAAMGGCTATETHSASRTIGEAAASTAGALTRATVKGVGTVTRVAGEMAGYKREDQGEERSDNLHDLCIGWAESGNPRFCDLVYCRGVLPADADKAICYNPSPPTATQAVPTAGEVMVPTTDVAIVEAREGLSYRPYCVGGRVHTGIGHLLTAEEARDLACADIEKAETEAMRLLGRSWLSLNEPRRAVMWELCFMAACATFVDLISAVVRGDFDSAANELLLSEFARAPHSKTIAMRMATWMRTGDAV